LVHALPVRTGDDLAIEVELPAGVHAGLFLYTSEGKTRLLAQWDREDRKRLVRYPPGQGGHTLQGPAGTECVLVWVSRQGPVAVERVEEAFRGAATWPALPDDSLLRLGREEVTVEPKNRDVGPFRDRPDPVWAVKEVLRSVGEKLNSADDGVAALAFSHKPEP
jgi:hypothetical protein